MHFWDFWTFLAPRDLINTAWCTCTNAPANCMHYTAACCSLGMGPRVGNSTTLPRQNFTDVASSRPRFHPWPCPSKHLKTAGGRRSLAFTRPTPTLVQRLSCSCFWPGAQLLDCNFSHSHRLEIAGWSGAHVVSTGLASRENESFPSD